MVLLPVIGRELRVSARQSFTYYLRAVGAGSLLAASLLFGLEHGFGPTLGGKLFGSLHFTLFCAIWILVPLLTADCISRERREGTLGLLFLTALKGTDIVTAKGVAHGLRAITLWVAVLPVLTIPFLLGGVSWNEAVLSLLINSSALCWALAAGLLASAWSRAWLRALLRAMVLGLLFFVTVAFVAGNMVTSLIGSPIGLSNFSNWPGSDYAFVTGLGFVTNALGTWPLYLGLSSPSGLLWGVGEITLVSVLALTTAIMLAGAKTRRVWQEEPPSSRQLWWEKTFCTPVLWLSFFRRWMKWKLERNPIGWLEQRTWSGRLVTWGWFAVVISLYSAVLTERNFFRNHNGTQRVMALLLAGSMAMSAAGSFRRERESGVLELLLVSPLGEKEIMSGRLRGLWAQFFPAFALLLGLWAYMETIFPGRSELEIISFYGVTFLTLPVVGLYYSLRCRNFITAFLATLGVGLLAPMVLPATLGWLLWLGAMYSSLFFRWQMRPSIFAALFQVVIAAWCWERLHRRLKKRAFPLERTEG